MTFKTSRVVSVGNQGITKAVLIGGNNPIIVQTMWKEGIASVLSDKQALLSLLKKIDALQELGCDILRFAVPDSESADALCKICEHTTMPLVADIHFDYKLALRCLDGNIAKIRINPGNIGSIEKTRAVLEKAQSKAVPIRIGINAGSLPQEFAKNVQNGTMTRAKALAQTAVREMEIFDRYNFTDVIVSLKASDVSETIEANEAFANLCDVPLHIGVTEAGPLVAGIVKNTLACSRLLKEGVGSTIRVSLSDSCENEIICAKEILREVGLVKGVQIISCPRCGRNGFDVHAFINRWQHRLLSMHKDISVAVMGCAVNGPGEAKHADIGITGSGNQIIIFKKGKIVCKLQNDDVNILTQYADNAFSEELQTL